MKTGTIFDIKEFAIYDGPGLRQTVFLKGCPLYCNWCHNPEGLSVKPELMVSVASCIHCGRCKQICEHETCIACGKCIEVCPLRLRKICGTVMTSEELVKILHEHSDYYDSYGGGVTFSGGEPLLQSDFLLEVLGLLPDIHTAIETSGYTDEETFQKIIGAVDYVMMDIKTTDDEVHKKYIGVSNQRILANLKILCEGDKPFVIRIPLIPGVNDNEKNFRATAELIQNAKTLEKVEMLPYHKTAGAKYAMVGREYRPSFDVDRPVQISRAIFEEYGIRSSVL